VSLSGRSGEFEELRETVILAATRRRLVGAPQTFAPEIDWDAVIHRDLKRGYGLFLPDG
jgi:hypothetical protein